MRSESKEEVRARLQAIADRLGVPFDSLFIERTDEEVATEQEEWERFRARLPKPSREVFDRVLAKVPDAPPMKGDEWPPVKRSSRRAARASGAPAKPRRAPATKRARKTA